MPSLLSALGAPGFANELAIEPVDRACLFLVDGLGWEQLLAHPEEAPFLASVASGELSRSITASFPATTTASLASLGTGLPPGEHGLVGYTFALPGHDRAMNSLRWELYGIGPPVDLVGEVVPERFQPVPTVLERAEAAGLEPVLIGPLDHANSALTRAILRGSRYRGADSPEDLIRVALGELTSGSRSSAYAYYPWLDTAGHVKGIGSEEWLGQLRLIDRMAEAIAEGLPSGSLLAVTSDHGMVNLDPSHLIDLDAEPGLATGVRLLGGEARARHVYAEWDREVSVLAAWRERLGDRMWVASRDEAIADGWFGPRVADRVRDRIGDVVAAAHGPVGIVQRKVDPLQAMFVGHHGSMTRAEQLVPLLQVRT
jgi:predicted AlkP superfamily pyrophosphatase or phosphodiesterase